MYAGAYELVSFQLINPDKSKYYLKGTPKKGSYSIVGKYHSHDPIIIAEGFATAMSIQLSTGLPVFIGFDCHNLEPALATILHHHIHPRLVILAADNDEDGQGLVCAKKAITNLQLKEARIIMPNRIDYDWNDVYCEEGPETIRTAFREGLHTIITALKRLNKNIDFLL
jgi:putative DNA primase/helicase